MKFHTGYSVRKVEHAGFESDEDSRTKQEFKDECDINVIMKRYLAGYPIPDNVRVGRYGDFSDAVDFQEAQNIVLNAEEQFMALPAKVRERFKNNPFELLVFLGDKENYEEARSLGLLREEEAPPKVEPAVKPDATK